jgi:hypothetical protein
MESEINDDITGVCNSFKAVCYGDTQAAQTGDNANICTDIGVAWYLKAAG